jgi:uncharacterized RDD family membrane protein YckC
MRLVEADPRFPRALPPHPDLPLAGFGRRLLAGLLDAVFVFIGAAIAGGLAHNASHNAGVTVAAVVAAWAVLVLVPTAIWGRTLGKLICGERVVSVKGGRAGSLAALRRELIGRLVVGAFGWFVMPYLRIAHDERRQSWHDVLGRTVVVRTRL